MLRQIKLMAALETRNLFGLNVLRHTKDKGARWKALGMALLWVLLVALLCLYVGGFSYGLIFLGLGETVPAWLTALSALVLFAFDMFKTGGVIFAHGGLDTLCALPLRESAIVIGRFFRLYVEDLAVTLAMFLPGLGVYAWLCRPGALFYPLAILCILLSPLIPLALATLLGALITALTARMRHKSIVVALLSILATAAIFFGVSSLAEVEGDLTLDLLRDLSGVVLGLLGRIYPPAIWIGTALTEGELGPALLWTAVSLGVFFLVAALVSARFQAICRRLAANSARHDYRLTAQKGSSLLVSLCRKELRRYLASAIYVTNTIVGPIMGLGLAVALLFVDLDALFPPGLLPLSPRALIPFALAWPFCMMPTTAASVSLEGKNLWIVQSLPLSTKAVLDAKLLLNLLLDLPFFLGAVLLAALALKPSPLEFVWLLLFPGLLILLSCVLGLFANLHLPLLNWENETRVVKQSASATVACLTGMVLPILCAVAATLVPGIWVRPALCVLLAFLSLLLYRSACTFDLKRL